MVNRLIVSNTSYKHFKVNHCCFIASCAHASFIMWLFIDQYFSTFIVSIFLFFTNMFKHICTISSSSDMIIRSDSHNMVIPNYINHWLGLISLLLTSEHFSSTRTASTEISKQTTINFNHLIFHFVLSSSTSPTTTTYQLIIG